MAEPLAAPAWALPWWVSLPPQDRSFCTAVGLERLIDSRIGDIRNEARFPEDHRGRGLRPRHPHGRAGDRADLLRGSDRHLPDQCHGHSRRSGGGPPDAVAEAASSWSPATSATRTTSGSGAIANMIRWAAKTPTVRRRAAPNWLPSAYRASFFSNPEGTAARNRPRRQCVRRRRLGRRQADSRSDALGRNADVPARIRNPRNVRPWQHVLEPVRGYLMLGRPPDRHRRGLCRRLEFRPRPRRGRRRGDAGGPGHRQMEWTAARTIWSSGGPMIRRRRSFCASTARKPMSSSAGSRSCPSSEAVSMTVEWHFAGTSGILERYFNSRSSRSPNMPLRGRSAASQASMA